ncbi:unnamed protein product, partial [Mesorhabditis spiculigera]
MNSYGSPPTVIHAGDAQKDELAAWYMKKKSIDGWLLVKPVGSGANGLAFLCVRPASKQRGVIKVGLSAHGSQSILWEISVFKKMQDAANNEERTRHVARMFGNGVVQGQDGHPAAYVVVEFLPEELLKAIYDMHYVGFLHRDLKPENMGVDPVGVLVLYDMGMARSCRDALGRMREPRSFVGTRGTEEWASLHAELGRDQTYLDDLWGWLYTVTEFVNSQAATQQPWMAFDDGPTMRRFMKTPLSRASITLSDMPPHFAKIWLYLHALGSRDSPDYFYIGVIMNEARNIQKRRRMTNLAEEAFFKHQAFLEKQYF